MAKNPQSEVRNPKFQLALYPGDGIGPEVIDQAVRVLDRVQQLDGFAIEWQRLDWGYGHWQQHGRVVPEDFLDVLRPFDAILLGAVGWPEKVPDHVTLAPLVTIRQRFDQYACVRPVRLYPGVTGVLAGKGPAEIDFVVIRENSEGEYVDSGSRFHVGQPDEFALQTAIHTRRGVERILRFGFEMARTRRKRLTMVTKSNAQRYAYVLWDEILEQVRGEYADVEADKQHADACGDELRPRPGEVRRRRGLEPVRRLADRPGRHHRRRPGPGAQHEHQPRAAVPFDVRAGARLRAGHRRPRHRQPDRGHPQRRDDARLAGPDRAAAPPSAARSKRRLPPAPPRPTSADRLTTTQMADRVIERL